MLFQPPILVRHKSDSRTDGQRCTCPPCGCIVLFDRVYIGLGTNLMLRIISADTRTLVYPRLPLVYPKLEFYTSLMTRSSFTLCFLYPRTSSARFVDVRSSRLSTICFSRTLANQYHIFPSFALLSHYLIRSTFILHFANFFAWTTTRYYSFCSLDTYYAVWAVSLCIGQSPISPLLARSPPLITPWMPCSCSDCDPVADSGSQVLRCR